MGDLEKWCGPASIWTHLSSNNIIKEGGFIDMSAMTMDDRHLALKTLLHHALGHAHWLPISVDMKGVRFGTGQNVLVWNSYQDSLFPNRRFVQSTSEKYPGYTVTFELNDQNEDSS